MTTYTDVEAAWPERQARRALWSTVPAAEQGTLQELKGRQIRWTGTLTRSADDPAFGFLSRPRLTK